METLFVGTNVIFLPEVDSTNSYAIGLLKNVNLPEGTVIHTANQIAGRGQRGNVWNSLPHCNITASIVLNPSFLPLKKQFFLYQVAALACYDVLAEILSDGQYDIQIKWPNDILVDKRKIAGILIENIIVNSTIARSVIGIGINVKQKSFPSETNAVSLEMLVNRGFRTEDVLRELYRHLEKYYLLLKCDKFQEIHKKYLSHLFGIGTCREFEYKGKKQDYTVKGIDASGYLLLEDKEGKEHTFDVQEIKWVL
jgi:BirA family biotin operon repressor/biotin-[acetyl-CoA-carboxylase] ligase